MLTHSFPQRLRLLLAMAYFSLVLVVALPLPAPHPPLPAVPDPSLPAVSNPSPAAVPSSYKKNLDTILKIGYYDYESKQWRGPKHRSKGTIALCFPSRCFGYNDRKIRTGMSMPHSVGYYSYPMKAIINVELLQDKEKSLFEAFSGVEKLRTALREKGVPDEFSDPDSCFRAMMRLLLTIDSLIVEGTYDEGNSIEENLAGKMAIGPSWSSISFGYRSSKVRNGEKYGSWRTYKRLGKILISTEPTHVCYSLLDSCFGLDPDGPPPENIVAIRPTYHVANVEPHMGNMQMSSPHHPKLTIRLNTTSPLLLSIQQGLNPNALKDLKNDLGNIKALEKITDIKIWDAPTGFRAPAYIRAQLKYLDMKNLLQNKPDPEKPLELPQLEEPLAILLRGSSPSDLPAVKNENGKRPNPMEATPNTGLPKKVAKVAAPPSDSGSPSSLHFEPQNTLSGPEVMPNDRSTALTSHSPALASNKDVQQKPTVMEHEPNTEFSAGGSSRMEGFDMSIHSVLNKVSRILLPGASSIVARYDADAHS
ncbi:hypothetical protein F5880DRAFT_1581804 [Lentinula raphanica]|nr:hypothetical protein F5880DRAFT_1581804 [Lentinula raphanica]